MSACDTCRDPGACCRYFHVSRSFKPEQTKDEVRDLLRQGVDGFGLDCEPLPFEPVRPASWYAWHEPGAVPSEPEVEVVEWSVTCHRLVMGRCAIYGARPALCRDFEPGSNVLCVEAEVPPDLITLLERKSEPGG